MTLKKEIRMKLNLQRQNSLVVVWGERWGQKLTVNGILLRVMKMF